MSENTGNIFSVEIVPAIKARNEQMTFVLALLDLRTKPSRNLVLEKYQLNNIIIINIETNLVNAFLANCD